MTSWAERALRSGEWRTLLSVLDDPTLLASQTSGVIEVVRGRTKQERPKATARMLRSGLRLAEKLLPLVEDIPSSLGNTNQDWLFRAINHPGGRLAEFVIHATAALVGGSPQQGCGIPQPSKQLLQAMVSGFGSASAMARIVLCSNAHYFLWIDPTWARASLLPLFDWDRDALQAVQAWHGFLVWGRPGATILEALAPAAVQLASHLEELGPKRNEYGTFVARAAFSLPDDPLAKAWFQAFLASADDPDRARFAWKLDRLVESLRPEQKAEIWQDWLRRYLARRADLQPPPQGQELTRLFGWPFSLPDQLAELVERLEAMPGRDAKTARLVWRLQEGELAESDATVLARLVLVMLNRSKALKPWELPQLSAAIERLINEGGREALILELIDKYMEHGGLEHQRLVELLDAKRR